ncbi:cysteine synthase A [Staphylococcus pseudintermedius]|uniref:cysteine synthase A n=1 Tax=Staphylococcus pseudintermedius TaxID=283734 RepID=UPI000BBC4DE1|nr:cysteine synthase A [Staphylococcus pseudintermedius]EGQ3293606.1 cysteine synthase A [Staphylococcus pseudintermedius]EGQ3835743.1 cysteine synthase A [Staphylococcus pseudintermedius]EGQ4284481.1 cysteine synthase A [Staphylococcus pseudintermedius]EHK9622949.1 cysteine synthase A [Staphylococcus pseudintermedius]EHP6917475.1 cysteine synthase A [Staphylococcus pseudintermedius]
MVRKPVDNITDIIGQTPVVKLRHQAGEDAADIYVKLEYQNPGGSVKDRIALAMIEQAEKEGKIKPGDTIVEPTSGNTGIGLAFVCAAKGYKAVFTMPETMSMERRNLLKAYGAELVLTPGAEAMKGAIKKAKELKETHGYFEPQQFENPANPKVHELTTGPELVEQFEGRTIDAFLAGVGTGGTLSGAGKVLKEKYPDIQIVAIEPEDSPVLSGGEPGPHKLQGLGAGFIPGTLNTQIYDEIIKVGNEVAMETSRRVAKEEGILGGISSGAAIYAAIQKAKELGKGKTVVTVLPSNGERYLSTPLYNFE